MLGPIRVEPWGGGYAAFRGCTRIMDSVMAFEPGARSYGVNFPGEPITGATEDEVRDRVLGKPRAHGGRWAAKPVVWA